MRAVHSRLIHIYRYPQQPLEQWMPYEITIKKHTYRKAPYLTEGSRLIETPLKYFNRARGPVLISLRPFVLAEAWLREGLLVSDPRGGRRVPRGERGGGGLLCGREMEGKGGRGKGVGSREAAREDRWRREPGNLGTIEFSRAKPPAATGRRRYTYTLLLGPRLDSRQAGERERAHPRKAHHSLRECRTRGVLTDACGWSGI